MTEQTENSFFYAFSEFEIYLRDRLWLGFPPCLRFSTMATPERQELIRNAVAFLNDPKARTRDALSLLTLTRCK